MKKKKKNRLKRRRCQMFDNNRSPTGYDLFLFSSNFLSFKNTPGPKSISNHTLCSTCRRLLDFSIFISFHIQKKNKKKIGNIYAIEVQNQTALDFYFFTLSMTGLRVSHAREQSMKCRYFLHLRNFSILPMKTTNTYRHKN